MRNERAAQRLRIYCGESAHSHHTALAHAIVLQARDLGLAGATVVRGIEGFGVHRHLHEARLIEIEDDLPLVVEIVDSPAQITRLLDTLGDITGEAVCTLEDVIIVAYR